jgi:hypothetical protein
MEKKSPSLLLINKKKREKKRNNEVQPTLAAVMYAKECATRFLEM